MYCSSCGNQIKKGLNYCNSCGVRIVDSEKENIASKSSNLSTAITFVGLGGLLGFIVLVRTLLKEGLNEGAIITILVAYLATLFGICFMIIRQMSGKPEKSNVEFQANAPQTLKSADTNQLEEPKQSPASVVENTTRTLDKVPIERN